MASRAIPIKATHTPGGKTDFNDWFRCPRCGFINQWSKVATPAFAAIKVCDAQQESVPGPAGNIFRSHEFPALNSLCILKTVDTKLVALGYVRGDTVETEYYTARYYQPEAGCRFCGQVNLR